MTELRTCAICVENLNQTKNKPVCCAYCQFEACRSCCETYLLNENAEKCMNASCGKTWTRKFIMENFVNSFITGPLKKHKEDILFEKERALLPATQAAVEEELRKENLVNLTKEEHAKVLAIRYEYIEKRRVLMQASYEYRNNKVAPKTFIRACPDEKCLGFLSNNWKCGLCSKLTCSDCHVVKGLHRACGHKCNPDDVATAKLLASDTKPCPKCSTGIFKIDGCDQMFCTQCHTAFSWKTGNIETKIHNPHYFEWMRRNGSYAGANGERNPLDILCGREINTMFTLQLNSRMETAKIPNTNSFKVLNLTRSIVNINEYEIPKFQVDDIRNNQDLRVQYLRGKISEEKFKFELQKANKSYDKKKEIRDVLIMFRNAATDIIYRYFDDLNFDTINEIIPLIDYINNECLETISKTYNSVKLVMNFDKNLSMNTFVGEPKKKPIVV